MYYLAILNSGNYAMSLCRIMERKGYMVEVVSTPCVIAKDGCGYCLKFPVEYVDAVLAESAANSILIKEIYKVVPSWPKNEYIKIY